MTRQRIRRTFAAAVAATHDAARLAGRIAWVSLWQFPWYAVGRLLSEAVQCVINGWRDGRGQSGPYPS